MSAFALAGAAPGAPRRPVRRSPHSPLQHTSAGNSCHLGNKNKHVVELGFDNVALLPPRPEHALRPADDAEPTRTSLTSNGTFLSNGDAPLIARTAHDLLTTWTGLYGDRAGMPVSNSYQAYDTDGTTDPATSSPTGPDPVYDTASTSNPGHDTNPSLVYSATPPATTSPAPKPSTTTPAPWSSFTRVWPATSATSPP